MDSHDFALLSPKRNPHRNPTRKRGNELRQRGNSSRSSLAYASGCGVKRLGSQTALSNSLTVIEHWMIET